MPKPVLELGNSDIESANHGTYFMNVIEMRKIASVQFQIFGESK